MIQKLEPFLAFSADEPPEGGSLVAEAVSDLADSPNSFDTDRPERVGSEGEDLDEGGEGLEDSDSDFEPGGAEDSAPEVTEYESLDDVLPPVDDVATEQAQPQPQMNPRQQAYYEAQVLGKDSEWAENRAFDIYEERQAISHMQANAPVHVPALRQQFEQSGLPAEAAAPYYENLVKLAQQGFRNAPHDPQAQRVALANALGEYVLREQLAGRDAFATRREEPKRMVTPTNGASHGSHFNLSRLSRQDQRFISQWQASHNGGKPPTSKQLAAMEAEGLIG